MRIHVYGDASVIRAEDVPRPSAGPGEVLLRVAATSFNPSDVGLRRGLLRSVLPVDLPLTLGSEVAGTVVEVGHGVHTLAPGAPVIGRVDSGGTAAEFVTAAADTLVAAPATVPLAHAAAVPVAGLTAWQAVFDHANVTPGQRVLVNGAGGGVGGFAVQLARHADAHVIATAGPRSAATVRRLGAHQVIDYTTTPLAAALDEPVDAVLNLVALDPQHAAATLLPLLRPGGIAVSATVPIPVPAGSSLTTVQFVARNDTTQLAALVALIDTGAVHLDVTATRPLTDLPAVHVAAESGLIRGKTVLVP
ncbi:NADP-dependent oxidoreductase [Dactylosporangium sp. NPDC006015]|uniref:NADP-dependent oxidoreductase n=1 Tax=Dactylosporangium sp. NPDC006015 TaxID=3154576 RepID=UPI0033B381FB